MDRFGTCGDDACFPLELPRGMHISFESLPGTLVNYSSRDEEGIETVQLSGWLIPAEGGAVENGGPTPRIVVQHGQADNSNGFLQLTIAYRLRQMGFTVLLNNFRDHGYSGASENSMIEWGGAYPYDLLGAWDYLRKDPDNLAGGALGAASVGLMGLSMGGFTTLNAFGMEAEVPAAWADAPPFSPRSIVEALLEADLGGLMFLVRDRVYDSMLDHARSNGVDLERNLPERHLPMGPAMRRPLMLTTSPHDKVVPASEMARVLELLEKHPDKYRVESFYTEKLCPITEDNLHYDYAHCVAVAVEPEVYLPKMCSFWKTAFGQSTSSCEHLAQG
mmetsp:Transcript_124433/g.352245  ORF Transcript_124433/g.352245 Transcript_124433/m.352245 type:complete len:333 (+) Transcript_124433:3-1001(+)